MRGHIDRQHAMFVVVNLEDKVPADHPLRPIKQWTDRVLAAMRNDFEAAYSHLGRPGIPPEQLLKALLLQTLYSIPSEIKLMEAIDYNMLYRWFLDLSLDAPVWTPEAFSMNRQRFIDHDLVRRFFDRVVGDALNSDLISRDHFTIDGTLIQSLASQKSLQPIDGRSRAARQIKATNAAGEARQRMRRRMGSKSYQISQRIRKRVEQIIGWAKTVGQLARTRFLGHERIEQEALITGAAYNLLRMTRLRPVT